jgi:PAS domain S-box-containing protein
MPPDSSSELPDLPGLAVIQVRGAQVECCNAGARSFLRGEPGNGADWTEALSLDAPAAAQDWLAAPSPAPSATPHYARTEAGKRCLRLRAFPLGSATEGWIVSLEDVTEERDAIDRAKLEADHFHALIERSSEGISLFDGQSTILYEAPSNKRIHGYEPEEMEGKTLIDFCHPDDHARIMLRFKHLVEAPGVVETEVVRFRHKQGHYIYLEGTVLNATDDPRLRALVNNFREVTGRLAAERELRKAKTAAEEAQRLQQHFLTNLSHEFKTPLTLIRGPLESLAEDRDLRLRHARKLDMIFRNIGRLDGLLSELIDLARLEAGAFALKANRLDLCQFVQAQVEHFRSHARDKDIRLECSGPGHCMVFFDPAKLEKVLVNLLGNALKFSPADTTVRVSVYLRAEAEDQGEVEVAVSDEGPGMDEATRARVFERFFQGESGVSRGHEGMGIGMAIAREMVEMHGGALTVESEPGLGSTFTFTLPLGCEHLDPDDIDTTEVPEARPFSIGVGIPLGEALGNVETLRSGPLPRLLLVEDNLDMRAYLRMHLDLHYCVVEAENGREALEKIAEVNPAIILSDVMMPHLSGLELCRLLKADPHWAAVPIVLLSAKAAVDHRVEGLRAGADDYLTKPFSVAELLERLRARLPKLLEEEEFPSDGSWESRLMACLDANLARADFDVDELARKMGYSGRQLRRRTLSVHGQTPVALLLGRRLQRARELIDEGRYETVAEIAHAVGLSPGYFSRRYRNAFRVRDILPPLLPASKALSHSS